MINDPSNTSAGKPSKKKAKLTEVQKLRAQLKDAQDIIKVREEQLKNRDGVIDKLRDNNAALNRKAYELRDKLLTIHRQSGECAQKVQNCIREVIGATGNSQHQNPCERHETYKDLSNRLMDMLQDTERAKLIAQAEFDKTLAEQI